MNVLRRSISKLSSPPAEHRVLGVDASLTSTGYAYRISHLNGILTTGTIKPDALRGSHRLFYIRRQINHILATLNPTLVVIEDYAMGVGGPSNNNVFKLGELGGVLKLHFWENGFNVLPVSPTALKSAIALSGSAKKPDVIRSLAERFDINVTQHDEADAVGLMLVGEMKCGIRAATQEKASKSKSDRFDAIRQTEVIRGKPPLIRKSV